MNESENTIQKGKIVTTVNELLEEIIKEHKLIEIRIKKLYK